MGKGFDLENNVEGKQRKGQKINSRIVSNLLVVEETLSMLMFDGMLLIWVRTGAFGLGMPELGCNLAVVHGGRHGV